MNAPDHRTPYDHALHLINVGGEAITGVTTHPDGRSRGLDGATAAGVLAAQAGFAIASALLAVTDVLAVAYSVGKRSKP
ncbi:hypothetical protein ACGGAI_23825 [Streptomyces antibioticus]|uniref:hypothetical protein n=1 Tax=Streptomyces antibioticus TaxID=1890 RepID=UPI0037101651